MKKILIMSGCALFGLSALGFATNVLAAKTSELTATGIYVGLQGGLGVTNWQDIDNLIAIVEDVSIQAHSVHRNNGFATRVFAGVDINRYFAIESGFSYFFKQAYFSGIEEFDGIAMLANSPAVKIMAFDVFGKGKIPVADKFDCYAKLGANLLMRRWEFYGNANNVNLAFGAGVDYYITPHVVANIEWLRFNGCPRLAYADRYQPNPDMFLLGLKYRFAV